MNLNKIGNPIKGQKKYRKLGGNVQVPPELEQWAKNIGLPCVLEDGIMFNPALPERIKDVTEYALVNHYDIISRDHLEIRFAIRVPKRDDEWDFWNSEALKFAHWDKAQEHFVVSSKSVIHVK